MASDSVRTTDWLQSQLGDRQLVVLDATYTMPGIVPAAAALFATAHIPTARFFDIDAIADRSSTLPHMLPTPAEFQAHARALGISSSSRIVVYDRVGMMSAGRAWWMLRLFGHDDVGVLDGGMRKWLAEGRAITSQVASPPAGDFVARTRDALVRSRADMLENVASAREQVVDARSAARFTGTEDDPRPGLRRGHIPGSLNVPYPSLTSPETGELKARAELAGLFANAGIDVSEPIVTTCGTGVTAGALAFALHLLDAPSVAVYDGAWAEWGRPGDTPIAY